MNETTPQIRSAHGTGVNSHTFISFTNAIQQTYAIQKAIAALRPQDAAALQKNAGDYARRLRVIKARAASELAEAKVTRVVTVHDAGTGILLQEFGLEVAGVVQPAHGLTPSAAELRDMVKLLQREQDPRRLQRRNVSAAAAQGVERRGGREGLPHQPHRVWPVHRRPLRAGDAGQRRDDDPRAGQGGMTPGADAPPLLDITNLVVRRHGEALLDDVSLSVRRASLHVIVGPNGAGKSTLLSAILGQAAFEGRIVAHWRGNGAIGYVPQNFAVDPTLPVTVEDFLALTRQRRPVCLGLSAATRQSVSALLATVGLRGVARRPLAVLSGGELRRVAAGARARPGAGAADSRRADQRTGPRRECSDSRKS